MLAGVEFEVRGVGRSGVRAKGDRRAGFGGVLRCQTARPFRPFPVTTREGFAGLSAKRSGEPGSRGPPRPEPSAVRATYIFADLDEKEKEKRKTKLVNFINDLHI